jgi:glutaminyl-tRNA synthetase
MLKELIDKEYVSGWDDPRLPTISGMRRRGFSPESIQDFCKKIGVAKANSIIDYGFLEHCVREDLNKTAPRYMGVLNPLKIIIDNYPDDKGEKVEAVNNPEDPTVGKRLIPFSKEIYIEHNDFMEVPHKKFYRLAPGREVRLRYGYFITCKDIVKKNGEIVALLCTYDPATKGGYAPNNRRVKSTIHWVSAIKSLNAEIRLYDRLFTEEDPTGHDFYDFKELINPDSLKIIKGCKVEPYIASLKSFDRFQFERLGYFCIDPDSSNNHLVINRTVPLRDIWLKIKQTI